MDTRWGFEWTHHTATAPAQHTQPHAQRESQPQPTTVGQVVEGNGVRGVASSKYENHRSLTLLNVFVV